KGEKTLGRHYQPPCCLYAVSQNRSFQLPSLSFSLLVRLRNAANVSIRFGCEVNSKPGSLSSSTSSSTDSVAFCASFHNTAAARLSALATLIDSSSAFATA